MKTKPVNKKFKKFVKEWIYTYSKLIDSPWHMGDIRYMVETKSKDGNTTLAEIYVDSFYLVANYSIYPELEILWKKDPAQAKEKLAHEVAHIITHKLHELSICSYKGEEEVKEAWESTTEIIGRLINRYEEAKKKSPNQQ